MIFGVVIDPLGYLFGYLDPGTGSLVLQFLIAGLLSIIVALKSYWHVIKDFFRSRFGSKRTDGLEIEMKIPEIAEQAVEDVDKKAA